MDDRFASILGAGEAGAADLLNLRKALIYVTAIHVPIAGLASYPDCAGSAVNAVSHACGDPRADH